jgi:hypothetical protein
MAFSLIPINENPTIGFVIFAVLIAFLTFYMSSGSSVVNKGFLSNFLNSVETEYSIYSTLIYSILAAIVLVFVATKKFNMLTGVITVLVASLIYILMTSARGTGLNISIPSVADAGPPPHLGRDGVSMANMYPNKVGYGN